MAQYEPDEAALAVAPTPPKTTRWAADERKVKAPAVFFIKERDTPLENNNNGDRQALFFFTFEFCDTRRPLSFGALALSCLL